jgi:hypothetical protein
MRTTTSCLTALFLNLLVILSANSAWSEQPSEVRQRLHHPSPAVRKQAALSLAEANDADAIPVLIDLLAELPAEERKPIEEVLTALALEWAPQLSLEIDDAISRGIRRDAWASWWRRTNGPALLALLGEHTLTAEKRRKVEELITQLGSDAFKLREDASDQLRAYHRLALPRLREAATHRDAEVARRVKRLIDRIEREPDRRLPLAVLRLLPLRKPAGGIEALLAYLPYAEEERREEAVRQTLAALTVRNGKTDPALRHALVDSAPKVRALAAEVLLECGGVEERVAVRKLLADHTPSVRLRTALALMRAGEREGIAVLIDLLPLLSTDESGQAEDALYQLAGDTAPKLPGDARADTRKRRDAWMAWWKTNAKRVDPSRLRTASSLGYTVLCDNFGNRVFEIDRSGKERWSIGGLQNPLDAVVLPGQRVLIAEYNANRVTERDFHGKVLWQKQVAHPVNVQRLPNGHTFIACKSGPIVEVDRAGKEIYSLNNFSGKLMCASRSSRGQIACMMEDGKCLVIDRTGKRLKSFVAGHKASDCGGIELLANGHILMTIEQANKVVQFDGDGKMVRQWNAAGVSTATALPNGRILITRHRTQYVYEVDGAGKILWEYKGSGTVYRARRR